jgi:hypothetical protein
LQLIDGKSDLTYSIKLRQAHKEILDLLDLNNRVVEAAKNVDVLCFSLFVLEKQCRYNCSRFQENQG